MGSNPTAVNRLFTTVILFINDYIFSQVASYFLLHKCHYVLLPHSGKEWKNLFFFAEEVDSDTAIKFYKSSGNFFHMFKN